MVLRKDEMSSPQSVPLKLLLQVAQGCWEPAPRPQPPSSCHGNTWVTHLGKPVRPLAASRPSHYHKSPLSPGKHLAPHLHPTPPALTGLHEAQQGRNHPAVPARQAGSGQGDGRDCSTSLQKGHAHPKTPACTTEHRFTGIPISGTSASPPDENPKCLKPQEGLCTTKSCYQASA